MTPRTVEIQENSRTAPKVVHVDKLKLYQGSTPRNWISPGSNSDPRPTPEPRSTPDTPLQIPWSTPRLPRRQLEDMIDDEPDLPSDMGVESGVEIPTQDEETTLPPSPTLPATPGRPRRQARRPSRFQDAALETQFVPSQQGKRESQPPADEVAVRVMTTPYVDPGKRLVSPRAFLRELPSIRRRSIRLVSPRQFLQQSVERQPNPDQSNSWLPVRLASPMMFYQEWIQQSKVPPDQTPSVPVNVQSNCPVKVELNDGDVEDQVPASAVGLQAANTPSNSTGSNSESCDELTSASPIGTVSNVQLMRPIADTKSAPISQAGEPVSRVVRADTGMITSNRDRRPDNDSSVYHPSDEAINDNVHFLSTYRDRRTSRKGVPVTGKGYNDVRTSNTEVRVQGASPPADQRVLHGRAKGRTSSTPSAQSAYTRAQRSDIASSRSTSSLHEKSKPGTTLGETDNTPKSNLKFDSRVQSMRRSITGREDRTSPSSRGCFLPGQFDILMSDSDYESDKVELSAAVVESPVITKFNQSNYTMEPKSGVITGPETSHSRKEFAPDRQRPIMSRQRPTRDRQQSTTSCQRPTTSRECLVKTPNYAPKFERGDNNASRSTALCKPCQASSTTMQQVASIRMTARKCTSGVGQHCNCSTKPFNGSIKADISCKVPFPRSNCKRIFNAQFPTGKKELNFPSRKIADSFAEAQSSTRRILRQNRIEMNQ